MNTVVTHTPRDLAFEDLRERILEMVMNDPAFQSEVNKEWDARFPTGISTNALEESICMCQIIVGRELFQKIL